MATEFKLPELGENITSGTIARVLVSKGDSVSKGQSILEVETDKAVVEVPCGIAGKVAEVKVSDGDTIKVGDVILVLDASDSGASAKSEEKDAAPKKEAKAEDKPVKKDEKKPAEKPAPKKEVKKEEQPDAGDEDRKPAGDLALASPSVRRLARELDVKLEDVPTSDPDGRITAEDVKSFVRGGTKKAGAQHAATSKTAATDEDKWGSIAREPMSAVRRKTAQHMTHCWTTIPHVTHFDKADITALEAMRKKHGRKVEQAGGKLTVTSFIVKVVVEALQRFPQFNASVDMEREEIVYRQYFNVGVAADTPNGLLVPVLKNTDQMSITEITLKLGELAEKARERKLALEDMQGGTFTISNLGGIGGHGFTPIINSPEAAILGVSRASYEPVLENGQFAPRLMLPLSLSYDHRVIDGADAARFARWICETLENPWALFLED